MTTRRRTYYQNYEHLLLQEIDALQHLVLGTIWSAGNVRNREWPPLVVALFPPPGKLKCCSCYCNSSCTFLNNVSRTLITPSPVKNLLSSPQVNGYGSSHSMVWTLFQLVGLGNGSNLSALACQTISRTMSLFLGWKVDLGSVNHGSSSKEKRGALSERWVVVPMQKR